MPLEVKEYERRTFYIDAVQVTAENMEDVAKWCDGKVQTALLRKGDAAVRYVKVRVHLPKNKRQTEAYIGDWVLYVGTGYKVYTPRAFESSFKVRQQPKAPVVVTMNSSGNTNVNAPKPGPLSHPSAGLGDSSGQVSGENTRSFHRSIIGGD